jgi:hypothetical protein
MHRLRDSWLLLFLLGSWASGAGKVCGIYSDVAAFDSRAVLQAAVDAKPPFLSEKHRQALEGGSDPTARHVQELRDAHFNTVFLTLYPLDGQDWWAIPAARAMVKDALVNAHAAGLKVHLGLSLFNEEFCGRPAQYPGASNTVQRDGTQPSWVCFLDNGLWDVYIKNCVEMAKVGNEVPGALDGIFLDPEAYGPQCYLCFCDECVRKYDAFSGQAMPVGLVKPDSWLLARGLWKNYTVDFHDHEVRRHAEALRDAVHAVDPTLQLSSLLWDYPAAVGIGDARERFFRELAIGLGTRKQPSWTMTEQTYYSNAGDLSRIMHQIMSDIAAAGASGRVKILPGLRLLRRSADSLMPRGKVVRDSDVAGYWLYELADLEGKKPIEFEGRLIDSPPAYWRALGQINQRIGR